tara:strand:+ start:417 stop:1202 length:786 start_codon:yes stop_codon:yes gene_type:complete
MPEKQMPKFSQNTLNQVAGFDGQILAEQLCFQQADFWNFQWSNTNTSTGWVTNTTPIDLTNVTIDAQIVRRDISNYNDSRTGLNFTIADYPAIPLIQTITATDATNNTMRCTSTSKIYVDQPITFTGTVFGGVVINTTYYVREILTLTTFTISATQGGAEFVLTTATGSMAMDKPNALPIALPITNRVDANGSFTMTVDDSVWGVVMGDPDLDIASPEPAAFSGRLKLSFPPVVNGTITQPAYDQIVFILFTVVSDAIVNY